MNPLLAPAWTGGPRQDRLEMWSHRVLLILLVVVWCASVLRQVPESTFLPDARWPEGILLVLLLLVTLSVYARSISLQSALMAGAVVGLVGSAAHWCSYLTAIPFGPVHFPDALERSPFQGPFCALAVLWVVLLLNARGLARSILLPWVQHRLYGVFLLGLSVLLLLLMTLALEPFASGVQRYWLWGETRLPISWQGVPMTCFFAWIVVSIIASLAATPFLISKRPRPLPPAAEPAWVWMLIGILLAVRLGIEGLWPAFTVAVLNTILGGSVAVVGIGDRNRSR